MERYVCIHGHFYQPPRENAWLEAVELQDSAYPYHDWNQRITAECYEPNRASRILDSDNRIVRIVDNYAKISFDFGPTLLTWMERETPDLYEGILLADKESQRAFSGHGSALAQAYNHMIMPLATTRDKRTQVRWGIADFEHRFRRSPEGMWLPETAVDLETLDIMAELGIGFTVLAPRQASRVRSIGDSDWRDAADGGIDSTMPYELCLPSGRTIAIFFYDDAIARAVAFEGLLASGEDFANRLVGAFSTESDRPELIHVATDGETYGHHHRWGDMALAYALHYIESRNLAQLTNYGEHLHRHPPTHQVEIAENTSWSCIHGVERWRSDCGCSTGAHPQWNQKWRAPLRDALNWLRDDLARTFESHGRQVFTDPWAARDDYVSVILDRSPDNIDRFMGQHAIRQLDEAEKTTALKLLELERHAMLMFTSCGWFFEDLARLEAVQVIQYAGRAIQLAHEFTGDDIEALFLTRLEKAKSNVRQRGDGRRIYETSVTPAMVDLTKVAAHYAIDSLFEEYGEEASVYCYRIGLEDYQLSQAGRARLALGRANVTSNITRESALLSFGVLHFGDHNLNAGVCDYDTQDAYRAMVDDMTNAFNKADFPEVIRAMDSYFGSSAYSARSLFRDEQRRVLNHILESTLSDLESAYRGVYEQHYPLMRFLADLHSPLPRAFRSAADFVVNVDLRRAFEQEAPDLDTLRSLLEAAEMWGVELDTAGLTHALELTIGRLAEALRTTTPDATSLENFAGLVELARSLPFEIEFRKPQNVFYHMFSTVYPGFQRKSDEGDQDATAWVEQFRALGESLRVRVG